MWQSFCPGHARRAEIVDEDLAAEQQHPQRKYKKAPIPILASEQEKQCQSESEERYVTRHELSLEGNCRRRHHEDCRHLDGVNVHQTEGQSPYKDKCIRING